MEESLGEVIWLIALLANQEILIHNLQHRDEPKPLLIEDEIELLTNRLLRCGRAASPVWREPPVRTNGATPVCLLSYFAIAGSSQYTSLIERSLDGSTLSISIL